MGSMTIRRAIVAANAVESLIKIAESWNGAQRSGALWAMSHIAVGDDDDCRAAIVEAGGLDSIVRYSPNLNCMLAFWATCGPSVGHLWAICGLSVGHLWAVCYVSAAYD